MGKLSGKIALVTGANSGIGLATAKRFAAEGAFVFMAGRRQAELDAAVAAIGGDVLGIQTDIARLDDLDRLVAVVKETKGRIDILFANAGLGEFLPLGQISEEHFDQTFGVNVKGTLFTVQKALPLMTGGGSIILAGSTAGSMGAPAFSVYGASKAAIRSFARNWILDLKGSGIRVNVLAPGPTATPGAFGLVPEAERGAFAEMLASQVPLGRVADPTKLPPRRCSSHPMKAVSLTASSCSPMAVPHRCELVSARGSARDEMSQRERRRGERTETQEREEHTIGDPLVAIADRALVDAIEAVGVPD